MSTNDDLVLEPDEDVVTDTGVPKTVWRILVVDDDQEVHIATDFALQHVEIFGRRLELTHSNSRVEAQSLLLKDRDFAVILLDVVMETDDAGLQAVKFIRDQLGMAMVRIILRTGQPGYAPELTVFNNYDINDYRTKSELTRTRLITAISAALRSYDQIATIAENKRSLELIIQDSTDLVQVREVDRFAALVLEKIGRLLRCEPHAVFCAAHDFESEEGLTGDLSVIGASGRLAHLAYRKFAGVDDEHVSLSVADCLAERGHRFGMRSAVLYVGNGENEAAIFLLTEQPLGDQEQQLLRVFATNIAASLGSMQLFERLNFTAYHDALTGLRNRNRFILDLNEIAVCEDPDIVVALVDLEHFSDLNDGLGQDTGNALLIAVAQRLEERLGSQCLLARIGADVFGLIGPEKAVNPGNLFQIFSEPFSVLEHSMPASVVLGLCRMLEEKPSGIILLKRANIALNRAKRDISASHAYFLPEMEDSTRWRLEIIHRLREDFAQHSLSVWYQPQIDMATGNLVSIEALLRWPRDGGGFIQPPEVFVPLAEYSGLIVEIGRWVLDRACADFYELSELPGAPQRVAVNVSMAQFRQSGMAQDVARTMGRHGINIGELELEITESIAMHEPRIVLGTLLAIKTTGARIAVDDFGTGFSSLTHLRQLPIDALKIDKSFIGEIANGRGGMFAEMIVALGAKLGVAVVAEGVETSEQAGFLRGLGCPLAQGFLYARPMPLEEIKAWIIARNQDR